MARYFTLLLFFLSCSHKVELPCVDYGVPGIAELPNWECHQIYSIQHEADDSASFLEVTVFPKKKYPGISLPWVNGDWRNYKTFEIVARARGGVPIPFILSIFDGKGEYMPETRYGGKYLLDTCWTSCELSVSSGLRTQNGRKLDMSRIGEVVFFTLIGQRPITFDIRRISLR